MSAEVDFLPFAVGSGANVLDQADYAALTTLLQNGFSSGIAQSAQLNKVWRQSSIMAAVVAQFIAQQTGQPAIDDGTTATLLANLTAAVKASVPGVVGQSRNLSMTVATASSTATLTADEVIVESALGGLRYCLSNFSETINLATTGAGGMDTGSAPVSGYVGIYAIYAPATGATALLATNATSTVVPNVYGGANMPSGYTASALVSVWPTNASSQFVVGVQYDRMCWPNDTSVLSSSATQTTPVALSIASAVPPNAKAASFRAVIQSSASAYGFLNIRATANGIGNQSISINGAAANAGITGQVIDVPMITPQTIYWSNSISAGTPTSTIVSIGYRF